MKGLFDATAGEIASAARVYNHVFSQSLSRKTASAAAFTYLASSQQFLATMQMMFGSAMFGAKIMRLQNQNKPENATAAGDALDYIEAMSYTNQFLQGAGSNFFSRLALTALQGIENKTLVESVVNRIGLGLFREWKIANVIPDFVAARSNSGDIGQ